MCRLLTVGQAEMLWNIRVSLENAKCQAEEKERAWIYSLDIKAHSHCMVRALQGMEISILYGETHIYVSRPHLYGRPKESVLLELEPKQDISSFDKNTVFPT